MQGLTGLMLSGCDNITGMGFKAWPHVRKGTPSSTRRHSAPGTPHASASDPPMHCKLQSVSLSVCTALSDQAIQHLCMAAPGLVRLDFSQCGQITDRALSALVTLPHLTSTYLVTLFYMHGPYMVTLVSHKHLLVFFRRENRGL